MAENRKSEGMNDNDTVGGQINPPLGFVPLFNVELASRRVSRCDQVNCEQKWGVGGRHLKKIMQKILAGTNL